MGGWVGQNICHLETAEQGGRGCLSKGSEVQFIKITLQVPGGAEAATPPPPPLPVPDTRSEIRQAHSLIISEITEAALANPKAEAAIVQWVLIIYQENGCIHQSQTHSTECSVVGWAG